ncbi:MAG: DUF1028 domain-containing protein [candidate division Zixibacteria bacterium]|nr:DUF1028 domain-containing protein [candidate division Zixibacteria bacterium]MDH3935857.1 DUF1028 domain-containing protein [candidate division Zixibacteria bacterium]MDH4033771.1 DUF1028 domain-containing protein [candidate division Zixibacteria bacterium]
MFRLLCIVAMMFALFVPSVVATDGPAIPRRPVHTYSIVAFDSVTGQFGAAVQSHWFKVADVIWARSGVGAVATQSLADFNYGPLGLAMMQAGKSATQAMEGVLASDPQSRVRQVAMIDKNGQALAHTGSHCIDEAGHHVGHHYSVQANLMEKATVWPAMAEAFENSNGDLAERMLVALEAAQAEGGDIRGKQSAALLVVSGEPTGRDWSDRLFDLRVDDSPEPLVELRRLVKVARAYEHMNQGDLAIETGDFTRAEREYGMAATLAPGNLEVRYWQAVTLVGVGQTDMALPIFRDIFAQDSKWRDLIPRLVKAELLQADSAVIEKIMKQ